MRKNRIIFIKYNYCKTTKNIVNTKNINDEHCKADYEH